MVLFNTKAKENDDTVLLGGFMIAINQMGKSLTDEDLSALKLGKELVVFYKNSETNLILIGRTKKITSEKRVRLILKRIYQQFEKKYTRQKLAHFDGGDINVFRDFRKDIDDYFQDKTHVIDGMW